jgi:hypothetical protein
LRRRRTAKTFRDIGVEDADLLAFPDRTGVKAGNISPALGLYGTPFSRYFTYCFYDGVFTFCEASASTLGQLTKPVRVMERTRIYSLGEEAEAKPTHSPNRIASAC